MRSLASGASMVGAGKRVSDSSERARVQRRERLLARCHLPLILEKSQFGGICAGDRVDGAAPEMGAIGSLFPSGGKK